MKFFRPKKKEHNLHLHAHAYAYSRCPKLWGIGANSSILIKEIHKIKATLHFQVKIDADIISKIPIEKKKLRNYTEA